jgi:hypothetical protein
MIGRRIRISRIERICTDDSTEKTFLNTKGTKEESMIAALADIVAQKIRTELNPICPLDC